MDLITIMEEVGQLTTGLNSMGQGPLSYSNLDKKKSSTLTFNKDSAPDGTEYPKIWVYPLKIQEEPLKSSAIEISYFVEYAIYDLSKYNDVPAKFREQLNELHRMAFEFNVRLRRRPEVKNIGTIQLLPAYHKIDINLIGYVVRFQLTVNNDFTYPC